MKRTAPQLPTENLQLLLFDLGGVLIEWVGTAGLEGLTRGNKGSEEARRFWLESPAVRLFETGQCTPEEFSERVVDSLGLEVTPQEFLQHFLSWDRGPFEDSEALLTELSVSIRLGCLSNNNILHWTRLREETSLPDHFEYQFISHEIGLMKPDREVFEYTLEKLPFQGAEILFLDDNPECVEAARNCGLIAQEVHGPRAVRDLLSEFGLL